MKRLYVGIALLVLIFFAGIGLTAAFSALHQPLAQQLDQAKAAAVAGEWDRATALVETAWSQWQKCRHFTAAVADHEPIEQMDALFVQIDVLGKLRKTEEFAARCGELSRLAAAMADSQRITWWNIL